MNNVFTLTEEIETRFERHSAMSNFGTYDSVSDAVAVIRNYDRGSNIFEYVGYKVRDSKRLIAFGQTGEIHFVIEGDKLKIALTGDYPLCELATDKNIYKVILNEMLTKPQSLESTMLLEHSVDFNWYQAVESHYASLVAALPRSL